MGLLPSLIGWVRRKYLHHWRNGVAPDLAAIGRLERVLGRELPHDCDQLTESFQQDHQLLLDAVDNALASDTGQKQGVELQEHLKQVEQLKDYLDEARSVYTVSVDEDGLHELQLRQPPELTAVAEKATEGTSVASQHLREAWSKAFARAPDPNSACIEVVKAIEVAAKPVITPADQKATLGKMIVAMRAAPSKWTTDSGAPTDIESVASLMELVWTGCPRHGDDAQPAAVTAEYSQMLVQAGALLVHWFLARLVRAV